MMAKQQFGDAAVHFRQALLIDPDENAARVNLGVALANAGERADATAQLEEAVRRQPNHAMARCRLGDLLSLAGRDAEALGQYREAFALAPALVAGERVMRGSLTRHGHGEEVRAAWHRVLTGPPTPDALDTFGSYAEFCLFIGRDDAYRAARAALLEGLATNRDPRAGERAGRTCLLLPPESDDDLRRATAAVDKALEADRTAVNKFTPYFLFAKGLAEYRAGRMEAAVRILEGDAAPVLGPAPKLVAAMARHRLGQTAEAREALAQAVRSFDWGAAGADHREAWMYHVLRREAEAMISPNLLGSPASP
jgi:serine/threonine-protein kinase